MNFAADAEQVLVGLVIALVVAMATGAWRLSKRLTKQDGDIAAIKKTLDQQFGGNSGGIREAINAQGVALHDVSTRLDEHIALHVRHRL